MPRSGGPTCAPWHRPPTPLRVSWRGHRLALYAPSPSTPLRPLQGATPFGAPEGVRAGAPRGQGAKGGAHPWCTRRGARRGEGGVLARRAGGQRSRRRGFKGLFARNETTARGIACPPRKDKRREAGRSSRAQRFSHRYRERSESPIGSRLRISKSRWKARSNPG